MNGVAARVKSLREFLMKHADLLELGISATGLHPKLAARVRTLPLGGPRAIRAALEEARAYLRQDADLEAASLSLTGLVVLNVLWHRRGFMRVNETKMDALIIGAVRPLFRGN